MLGVRRSLCGPPATNGFKDSLVKFGQNGDVYRHIIFTAGATLVPDGGKINEKFTNYDRDQIQPGTKQFRPESISEWNDDIAGKAVGNLMKGFFKSNGFTQSQLAKQIADILCK